MTNEEGHAMAYRLFKFLKGSDGRLKLEQKELSERPRLNFGRTPERPPALLIRRNAGDSSDSSPSESDNLPAA